MNEDEALQSLRSQLADVQSQLTQMREQKQRAQEEVLKLQVSEDFWARKHLLFSLKSRLDEATDNNGGSGFWQRAREMREMARVVSDFGSVHKVTE